MSKSRKKGKDLLPKRIGGVKVPKAVRRGRFAELIASRKGQALIAEAVMGAGAAAAGWKAKDDPKVKAAARKTKDKAHQLADQAGGTGAIALALVEAARAFSEALHRAPAESRSFKAEPVATSNDASAATPETTLRPEPARSAFETGPL